MLSMTTKVLTIALFLLHIGCKNNDAPPQGISPSEQEHIIYHPLQGAELVSNEVAVYANELAADGDITLLAQELNGQVVGTLGDARLYQIRFANPSNDYLKTDEILSKAKASPHVRHAFYNSLSDFMRVPQEWMNTSVTENITWAQEAIGLPNAWGLVYDPAVVGALGPKSASQIAVIDAAFNTENGDLRNYSVIEKYGGSTQIGNCISCKIDHGNAVAALIGASSTSGTQVSGVNWNSMMHLYPLLRKGDGGNWCGVNTSSTLQSSPTKLLEMEAFLTASLRASKDNPVVINYSLGKDWTCKKRMPCGCAEFDVPTQNWLDQNQSIWLDSQKKDWYDIARILSTRNVLVVLAAGNNSDIPKGTTIDAKYSGGLILFADTFSNIMVVASLGSPNFSYQTNLTFLLEEWKKDNALFDIDKYKLSGFSSTGSLIDIAAPGAGIGTIGYDGQVQQHTGTSFSAPLVAGVASLIWYINPKLSPSDVKSIVIESGKSGFFARQIVDTRGISYNFPVLDAEEAVRRAILTVKSSPACADNCNGHGTCTSANKCACYANYGGSNCNTCGAGYSNYPDCTSTPADPFNYSWTDFCTSITGPDGTGDYLCNLPKRTFRSTENFYLLTKLTSLKVNYRLRYDVYFNGAYQWQNTSSWHPVGGGLSKGYFQMSGGSLAPGTWTFEVFVEANDGKGFRRVDSQAFAVIS